MKSKVRIVDIAIYHPEKVVTNEIYVNHMKSLGQDVEHYLRDVLGRNKRYIIDNTDKNDDARENSLTMQITAAKLVLEKCNIKGSSIDGIIVTSQIPESFVPSNSLLVHNAIHGKLDCLCYDINANCNSMLTALEQAYLNFEYKEKMQRFLIVGGDYLSIAMHDSASDSYGCFGDAACALILERTNSDSGFVAIDRYTHSDYITGAKFPGDGLSKCIEGIGSFPVKAGPTNSEFDIVVERIRNLIESNHLSISDIKAFCFSQYVYSFLKSLRESLNLNEDNCPYIGDTYGYTGLSSTLLALESAVQKGTVKHGDYVLLWTIGTGHYHIFELIKY